MLYSHLINKMVNDMIEAGLITKKQSKAAYESIEKSWEDKIAAVWTVDDVLGRADEIEYELTKEQAISVLEDTLEYHDSSYGINWDIIDKHIEDCAFDNGIERKEHNVD